MVEEVLHFLDCGPGESYVDATLGDGGHAEAILEASAPDGFLVGIDRDREALEAARGRLGRFEGRTALVHANFSDLKEVLKEVGIERIDGLLLDLGVSSRQLDEPERGFSFRFSGPLDMRMDRSDETTAAALIRRTAESDLAALVREYGEERRARRVARLLRRVAAGGDVTTERLAGAVAAALGGGPSRRGRRTHPATRTFQALRIAVNREMEALDAVLALLPDVLAPGGRCCCLSYHSLEDRRVKRAFRALSVKGGPLEVLTAKPLRPSEAEVGRNPRSRPARLRAARRRAGEEAA